MSPSELVGYQNRLQGRLGEILALHSFSELEQNVTDLNLEIMTNMPGYDVKSGDDWVSVKTLSVASDKPNLSSYRHHLDVLSEYAEPAQRGKYEGQGLPLYAANTLTRASKNGENAADLVSGRSAEELAETLQQRGCLALPDDHVKSLQNYLQDNFREYVSDHPGRYSIDSSATEAKQERAIQVVVDDYCRRLRPLGFTSNEIRLALNRVIPLNGRVSHIR